MVRPKLTTQKPNPEHPQQELFDNGRPAYEEPYMTCDCRPARLDKHLLSADNTILWIIVFVKIIAAQRFSPVPQ